jgi:hypothetical protein
LRRFASFAIKALRYAEPDFRGNLDSWDPALVDDLAAARRVVAFDNAGVGPHPVASPLSTRT